MSIELEQIEEANNLVFTTFTEMGLEFEKKPKVALITQPAVPDERQLTEINSVFFIPHSRDLGYRLADAYINIFGHFGLEVCQFAAQDYLEHREMEIGRIDKKFPEDFYDAFDSDIGIGVFQLAFRLMNGMKNEHAIPWLASIIAREYSRMLDKDYNLISISSNGVSEFVSNRFIEVAIAGGRIQFPKYIELDRHAVQAGRSDLEIEKYEKAVFQDPAKRVALYAKTANDCFDHMKRELINRDIAMAMKAEAIRDIEPKSQDEIESAVKIMNRYMPSLVAAFSTGFEGKKYLDWLNTIGAERLAEDLESQDLSQFMEFYKRLLSGK